MTHWIAGREPSGEIAAGDGVEASVGERQKVVVRVGHPLPPGRVHIEHVQHLIGAERKNDDRDKSKK